MLKHKLLNHLLITHGPQLRKSYISSDLLTPPKGRLKFWCQTWPGNTQGVRFSKFALCIQRYVEDYRSSADIFTHIKRVKYLGTTWLLCYNVVRVK